MEETLHAVKFEMPLSGSTFFDIHILAMVVDFTGKIPGLYYKYSEDKSKIIIEGELTDMWYKEYTRLLGNSLKIG